MLTFFLFGGPGHEAGQTKEDLNEGTRGLLQEIALCQVMSKQVEIGLMMPIHITALSVECTSSSMANGTRSASGNWRDLTLAE